jgi:NDP-sugar pyrophosphorylase family protein
LKAVLLAAGYGERLRPLTESRPKCMVAVGGRPILERHVHRLRDAGITELAINLHHRPEAVTGHFGDGAEFGVAIRWSHEDDLLGTAGALVPLTRWLGDQAFLVLYADNIIECDLGALLRLHRERRAAATIALFERDDVGASGVAEVTADGTVERFVEKPRPGETASNLVSAGLLACSPLVLDFVPAEPPSDIGRDVLPALLVAGETVVGYRLSPPESLLWIDTPADLARAERAIAAAAAR